MAYATLNHPGLSLATVSDLLGLSRHSEWARGLTRQGSAVSQSYRRTVGFGLIGLIAESVCELMSNREVEKVFDGHVPSPTQLDAAT
jgi:hypothetical protein